MTDEQNHLDSELDDWARSFEGSVPPAPARDRLTDGARLRAARIAADRKTSRRLWGYRAAMAAAVTVLLAAGLTLSSRIDPRGTSIEAGEGPTLINAAWASTAGYVIEFEVPYASWDDAPDYFAEDHPRITIEAAVNSWQGEHADLTSAIVGLPVASVSFIPSCLQEPDAKYEVHVLMAVADQELVEQLAAYIVAQTGYPQPTIFSQTVYYSHEYPYLFYAEFKVRFDGIEYSFPYDFTIDEARRIARDSYLHHPTYSGHSHFGVDERFGDCAVYRVERSSDGALEYSIIRQTIDVDDATRYELLHSSIEFELDDEDVAYPWRDPVLELVKEAKGFAWFLEHKEELEGNPVPVDLHMLCVYLVPEEKYDQLQARQQQLIKEGRKSLPELTDEDWQEIRERAAYIEANINPENVAPGEHNWLEVAREEFDSKRARDLDLATRMGDEYRSLPELSDEERAQAEELAARLREASRLWYAEHAAGMYEADPNSRIQRSVFEIGGIPVRFHMKVHCNDPALIEDLTATMSAVPGLFRLIDVKSSNRYSQQETAE
ncbi:hypothetical protein JW859_11165 [bacterium]|nr:hypothetical protein [bacterium]